MKTFVCRLLLPLVLPSVLSLVLPLLVSGCGDVEEKKQEYFDRASKNFDEGNYDKARIEIKNVLRIDRKDAKAHYLYARIEERREQHQAAYAHYAAALELDPNNLNAKVQTGKYMLLGGKPDEAQTVAEEVLSVEPDNFDAIALQAAAMARQDQQAAAIQAAERLIKLYPEKESAALLLARLYQQSGQDQSAVATVQRALALSPDSIGLKLFLADLSQTSGNFPETERLIKEVAEAHPDRYEFPLLLARFYVARSNLDEAQKVLSDAVAHKPNDMPRKLQLIDFLGKLRSPTSAQKQLESFIEQSPNDPVLKLARAILYQQQGQLESAESEYRQLIEDNANEGTTLRAKNKLAELFLSSNQFAQSETLVTEILDVNPNDASALQTAGLIDLHQRDAPSAIAHLRSYLKDQPESSEILRLLAQAHQLNRQPALALETLKRAVAQNPTDPVNRLVLARYLMAQGDNQGALTEVDATLANDPQQRQALLLKTDLLIGAERWEDVIANARATIERYPEDPASYAQLGTALLATGQPGEAKTRFRKSISKDPRHILPYLGVVRAYYVEDQLDEAIGWLEALVTQQPDHRFADYLLGQIEQSRNNFDTAENYYRKAIGSHPQWVKPYEDLGRMLIRNGNIDGAIAVYQDGLSDYPDATALNILLASAYELDNNIDLAIGQYEMILDRNAKHTVAANNLAALLSDKKGTPADLKRALTLSQGLVASANPAFLDTVGWVYYKLNQFEQAVPLLEQAVQKAPGWALLNYHLGMAYYKENRATLAMKYLEKSLESEQRFEGKADAAETVQLLQAKAS